MLKHYLLGSFIWMHIGLFGQANQPNVLFILADDLGINALNCYGNEKVESPNIDQLFNEGIHFTNGYSNDPTCAPSRASIMTGQYAPRHKIYRVSDRYLKKETDLLNMRYLPPANHRPTGKQVSIAPNSITIAEALKNNGYATAAFGKCHFGSKDLSFGAHGFDEWVETTKHYQFKHHPIQEDILENEFNADYTTRKGIDFMQRKVAEGQPFFLYMPYYLVHKPLEPKQTYLNHFKTKYQGELDEEIIQVLAMIKSLDESVGQLLQAVKALNIEEETIVIFASDNGHYKIDGNVFNYPYRQYKGSTHEGGIRVPYIFKWKNKIATNTKSTTPIIHIDLYPTILGLTESVANKGHILDGEDLSSILFGKKISTKRDALIWQYTNYSNYNPRKNMWNSKWVNVIQSGGFKLTEDVETNTFTLYNLNKDPYEKKEMAANNPKMVRNLKEKLKAWKKVTGSESPKSNPNFIEN